MKIQNSPQAFSLTEVTIALGIIGFCALAVMGLLPIAIQTHRDSQNQTQAAQILSGFVGGFQSPVLAPGANSTYYLPFSTNTRWANGSNTPTTTAYFNADGTTNPPYLYALTYTIYSTNTTGYGNRANFQIRWPTNTAVTHGSLQTVIYFNSPTVQP